jgi:hypothetical protein
MWRLGRIKSARPPKAERHATPGSQRNRLAALLVLVTVACLVPAFLLSKGTQLLMPGPLTSAHGAIEKCDACHTKSGSGKLSWIHGLVASNPLADSKACLSCHKMPATAFNAHGASVEVLKQSTKRLTKIAAGSTVPQSARAQSIAFPMGDVMAGGLYCATCHQEHKGVNFNLKKISNEQCRSCHVLQFDSFDGHHPKFDKYPFERRTRIIYDHAGHFGKHYPELAKKEPSKRIPATCSTCHNTNDDKRVMAVASFDQTCATCHLDQIVGKERASGPKGISFLAIPGLDVETLSEKKAFIGEWPAESGAALTPFMKVLISRNEHGRAVIKAVDGLDLQNLTKANDDQIKAVKDLAWEIKGLFYALIKGKASEVLGDLNIGSGAKLSPNLVADLTANIPRDAIIGAQQEWLPNLATEMANGQGAGEQKQSGESPAIREPNATEPAPSKEPDASQPDSSNGAQAADNGEPAADSQEPAAGNTDTAKAESDGSRKTLCVDKPIKTGSESAEKPGQPEETAGKTDTAEAVPDVNEEALSADENAAKSIKGQLPLQTGTPRAIKARKDTKKKAPPEGATDTTEAKSDNSGDPLCADEQPSADTGAQVADAASETDSVAARAQEVPPANEQSPGKAAEQFDDLLFPTEEDLSAAKAAIKDADKAGQPENAAGKTGTADTKPDGTVTADAGAPAEPGTAATEAQTQAAPVNSIETDVDPEDWADYGGWYRQDYAIFYRPIGHKDKFTYTWLFLSGPLAPKGDTSPLAAVFDYLTSKDAQGSCTKCHSVDDNKAKGRLVNFSQASVKNKQGRFTNFIHEPHFSVVDNRIGNKENGGCLACHNLEKGRPYLKGYEQSNPLNFVSEFGAVKKELCQTCHTSSMARQDCLLCHKYHVNGVVTPVMNTKLPIQ